MKILESFRDHFMKKFSEQYENEIKIDSFEGIEPKIKEIEQEGKVKINFLEDFYAFIDFDKMTMKVIKETKRSKYGYKELSYYRYRKVEHMIDRIESTYKNVQDQIKYKEEKRKKRKEIENPYEVGDILYDSWGYEQTNVDFFQVVRTSDKSVWIRPIAGETVSVDTSDSGKIKPIKDEFISDKVMRKPLQVLGNGKAYISSRHGWISKYEAGDKGVHHSWGY